MDELPRDLREKVAYHFKKPVDEVTVDDAATYMLRATQKRIGDVPEMIEWLNTDLAIYLNKGMQQQFEAGKITMRDMAQIHSRLETLEAMLRAFEALLNAFIRSQEGENDA